MDKSIIQKIGQSETKLLKRAISLVCPGYYFRLFYKHNKHNIGKGEWNNKKACFTLSFDCDYSKDIEAIPDLLKILSEYQIKASFACIGRFIEKYPREHKMIITEGHEVLNHTYTHPDNEELNPRQRFNELTIDEQRQEIKRCDEICKRILNYVPMGFRIPHFGRLYSENIYSILKEFGYKYSSSTLAAQTPNFGLPFEIGGIMEFPLSGCPKHPFGVFDTYHSLPRGAGRHKKNREFYNLFKELIEVGIDTNSYINVYFDPQDVLGLKDFRQILDYLKEEDGEIWIATYKDIFIKKYGEQQKS